MSFKTLVQTSFNQSPLADFPPNARLLIDGLKAQFEDPRLYDTLVLLNNQIEQLQLKTNELEASLSSLTVIVNALGISVGTFSFTASVNDYNFGQFDICRLTSTGAINITSILAGDDGTIKLLVNIAAPVITIKHQVGFVAANRIICQGGADILLNNGFGAILYYDKATLRWRAFAL